jgi:hypothetical protein
MLGLMQIPGARVGQGPLDPHCEEPQLTGVVRKMIDDDLVLASDPGYVSFLKYYAGAAIVNDETTIHLWGPARAVSDLHWDYLVLTHDATYTPVCVAQLPEIERIEFYLSHTTLRRAGVYWARRNAEGAAEVEWHCADFLALLGQIVSTGGTFRAAQPSEAE